MARKQKAKKSKTNKTRKKKRSEKKSPRPGLGARDALRRIGEILAGGDCHVTERSHGSFVRTVALPATVDAEKAEASHKNGVVTITLPKVEARRYGRSR